MKTPSKTRSFVHMNESEMNQLVRNSFVRKESQCGAFPSRSTQA